MKLGNTHCFKLILVAAMLMLANRSHAIVTPYLESVSNTLTAIQATLTNNTAQERQQRALIGRALRTLAKPSESVASDYSLFVTAATQLGPVAQTPELLILGTNVFTAFTNEAQAQIIGTGNRLAALSEFVRTRNAASNNLKQAQRALDGIPSLRDFRQALFAGNQVFTKIATANRLAAIGEAKPGFAPNSVAGTSLTHSNRTDSSVVSFTDETHYTQTESGGGPVNGTYTYDRTGLNTATAVLTSGEGTPAESVTTVKLIFTAANRGKFTSRTVDDTGTDNSSGTFTIP